MSKLHLDVHLGGGHGEVLGDDGGEQGGDLGVGEAFPLTVPGEVVGEERGVEGGQGGVAVVVAQQEGDQRVHLHLLRWRQVRSQARPRFLLTWSQLVATSSSSTVSP